ncbi:MAG: DNA gyrase inhibitor YacG [Acidobacteriaceae bacterium]|nr:DNA gyrase inhibitor YacG [Acidobacteriaceae bacterium]
MASTVRCPICKREVAFNDPNMPFCSDRCRVMDLGNWASEKYVISTPIPPNEAGQVRYSDDDPEGSPQ